MSAIQHRLFLKQGRESAILAHHPWVFSGAVERIESLPDAKEGALCDLFDARGSWLARGTLHASSQIVCRILTWVDEPIDQGFFDLRCREALETRRSLLDTNQTDAYRLINAEGDRLPGLIVDRYGPYLVTQCLTVGMAHLQENWRYALRELLKPEAIVERSGSAVRDPGLRGRDEVTSGNAPAEPVWITENGLRFRVGLLKGQKTGFYLDQRDNRELLRTLSADRTILNGFAYSGAFGVYAGAGGAKRVVQVESSRAVLDEARVHWTENGLPEKSVAFVHDDNFPWLRATEHTSAHGWWLLQRTGTWWVDYGSSSLWNTGVSVDIDSWQHLAVVGEKVDSSHTQVTVYKDGARIGSANLDQIVGDVSR